MRTGIKIVNLCIEIFGFFAVLPFLRIDRPVKKLPALSFMTSFVMKRRKLMLWFLYNVLIGWILMKFICYDFSILFWTCFLSAETKKIFSESTVNSLPFLINTTFLISHQPFAKSSITDEWQLARLVCEQTSESYNYYFYCYFQTTKDMLKFKISECSLSYCL